MGVMIIPKRIHSDGSMTLAEAIKTNDNPYFDDYRTRSPFPVLYTIGVLASLLFFIVSCVQVYHRSQVVTKVESTYIQLEIKDDKLVNMSGSESLSLELPDSIKNNRSSIWYDEDDNEIITGTQLNHRYQVIRWKWLRVFSLLLFLLILIVPVVVYKLLHPTVRVPISGAYQSAKFGYTLWLVEDNTLYCVARDYLPSLEQLTIKNARKLVQKREFIEHTKIFSIQAMKEFELTGMTAEFFSEAIEIKEIKNEFFPSLQLYFNIEQENSEEVVSFVDSNWFFNK